MGTNGEKVDRIADDIIKIVSGHRATHNEVFCALETARAALHSISTWHGIQERLDKWLEEYFSRKGSRMN